MKPSNYQIYQRTGFIILAKAIEYCDSDVILDINWKKPNSRIYHYGTNTIEIFVTQSNGNTGRSLAFDPYIGFLMFKKFNCGGDFFAAFSDGRITWDIMEKTGIYDTKCQHFHIYKNRNLSSLTIQYR
jgi:hypothetical protein